MRAMHRHRCSGKILLLSLLVVSCKARACARDIKDRIEGNPVGPPPGAATWPAFPSEPPPARPFAACAARSGKLYDVGPGKTYETPTSVPWATLGPGDTVRVFHRAEPYRTKILLSQSGTPEAPIILCGVPSDRGERPVFDGERAETPKLPEYAYEPQQDRGVITVSLDEVDRYGTRPSHIVISGIEVRHGHPDYKFTGIKGDARTYVPHAAGVFIERGEDITLRDSVIRDNANGLFFAAGNEEALMTRKILVDGNYFSGNGTAGKGNDRRHTIYGEASGVTYQYNLIGPQREGAAGSAIKDRSAGTIVRYNWIEGGSRQLDLVEPEDSNDMMKKEPNFDEAWVYGNVIVSLPASASNVVHFGGDLGMEGKDRKGPLRFYDNTVLVIADEKTRYRTSLFQLTASDVTAEIRNNLFFVMAGDPEARPTRATLLNQFGTVTVGKNLATAGLAKYAEGKETKGSIDGFESITTSDEALFTDVATRDLSPRSDAEGDTLGTGYEPVDRQFSADLAGTTRKGNTIGAFGPR